MSQSSRPLFARNLTARASQRVAGNPDISRPEDSVGNCFPGLDMDVRALDRRFFPGLVFDFVSEGDTPEPERYGALLVHHDGYGDSDLRPEYLRQLDQLSPQQLEALDELRRTLYTRLVGEDGAALTEGVWYLDWVEQKDRRIAMYKPTAGGGEALDGLTVWRIVRGLEPDDVKIGLRRRDPKAKPGRDTMEFSGWRRYFTSPLTGVISNAYQPGELLMSMCSPWQHDFRDCACHYWASNRPDIVYGMPAQGASKEDEAEVAARHIDWIRADRTPAATSKSLNTMEANRPYQMDHFQINRTWEDLNIVLGNAEIEEASEPKIKAQPVQPYSSGQALIRALIRLAHLEATLAFEYLYAYLSIIPSTAVPPKEFPDVVEHANFVRNELLTIAVGEMQHLRWANELIWTLKKDERGNLGTYRPVITPATRIPNGKGRKAELRPLTDDALNDFVNIERPSNSIDGQYAKVVATLEHRACSSALRGLASLIVSDGVDHYRQFLNIKAVVEQYRGVSPAPYLRPLKRGHGLVVQRAQSLLRAINRKLRAGYSDLSRDDAAQTRSGQALLNSAHQDMIALMTEGEALAAKGHGIPFF